MFNINTFENDIALIKLATPVQFKKSVQPIAWADSCNTTPQDIAAGQKGLLCGWGYTCDTCTTTPDLPSSVEMNIIDRAAASSMNAVFTSGPTQVTQAMIAFREIGKGSAKGDSGSPGVINKNGNNIAIGLASWGKG